MISPPIYWFAIGFTFLADAAERFRGRQMSSIQKRMPLQGQILFQAGRGCCREACSCRRACCRGRKGGLLLTCDLKKEGGVGEAVARGILLTEQLEVNETLAEQINRLKREQTMPHNVWFAGMLSHQRPWFPAGMFVYAQLPGIALHSIAADQWFARHAAERSISHSMYTVYT